MTKSADHEQASPSSPPAYVFKGPAHVAIRTRTNDQPRYVDTRLSVWTWYDGGIAMTIDWTVLQLNSELIEIGKGFMAYALEKYAPRTAAMFADSLRFLSNTNLAEANDFVDPDRAYDLFWSGVITDKRVRVSSC